jgi:hypothetical protein
MSATATSVGTSPGNSYEYERKGLMKFAFRKSLILEKIAFEEQTGPGLKEAPTEIWGSRKKKSGSSLPHFKTQLLTRLSVA